MQRTHPSSGGRSAGLATPLVHFLSLFLSFSPIVTTSHRIALVHHQPVSHQAVSTRLYIRLCLCPATLSLSFFGLGRGKRDAPFVIQQIGTTCRTEQQQQQPTIRSERTGVSTKSNGFFFSPIFPSLLFLCYIMALFNQDIPVSQPRGESIV